MIIIGLLLLVWGGLLLGMARPLHDSWREMLGRLRAAGYSRPPFGTRFVASERGLRAFRVAGGCGVAAGAALLVAGLLRLR